MNLQRIPIKECQGRTVRLLRDLSTRGGRVFRAGEEMTIEQKYHGLSLKMPGSKACWDITKVPYDAVMLLPSNNGVQSDVAVAQQSGVNADDNHNVESPRG